MRGLVLHLLLLILLHLLLLLLLSHHLLELRIRSRPYNRVHLQLRSTPGHHLPPWGELVSSRVLILEIHHPLAVVPLSLAVVRGAPRRAGIVVVEV